MSKHKKLSLMSFAAVFIWLCLLMPTDSFFAVYILIGLFSSYTILKNSTSKPKILTIDRIFALLFSVFVSLANYSIYNNNPAILQIIALLLIFLSGYVVFLNILLTLKTFQIKTSNNISSRSAFKTSLICFGIMSISYLIIFFLCFYPGVLTSDSVSQITQAFSDSYTNHHPVFVTIIMKAFIMLGSSIFGNASAGVATYCVFQIFLLSFAFSYSTYTLLQIGISRKVAVLLLIIAAIMPYNIMYSFTLWKDILFGIFFLIFIVSIYRFFKKLDRHIAIPLIMIGISSFAICLFRSNGLLAFFTATIIFLIIFKKQHLKLWFMLCGILILSFLLKRPLLQILEIPQADTVEALSIPMQQVTRTLIENKNSLSKEDLGLIANVVNPDRLIEEYNPILHDPIKNVIREEGNQDYLKDHKLDFLSLYLRLGISNPVSYTKAWINQTRGYWNGGYLYWVWTDEVYPNDSEIERTVISQPFHEFMQFYLKTYYDAKFLNPLISIGLFVWIMLFILYKSIIEKNKILLYITILLTAAWGTLLIATPVFSEFRYVYFLFTCIPFVTIISLTNKVKGKKYGKR